MHISRLDLQDIRSIHQARLMPGPGLNLLVGENGAGKTSVLEALHLLGYGRSFRGRVRDGLIRTGAEALQVYAEWQDAANRPRRVGLRHTGSDWTGRLDGEDVAQLGDLCAAMAVITFEPTSHALVSGGGDPRRRFLDWGLFHVEHDYLGQWRRYVRALKQRNALLKARNAGAQLDAWDHEFAEAGEPLHRHRQTYMAALLPHLQAVTEQLLPSFGIAAFDLQAGWKQSQMSLADALLLNRERDLALGHTGVGPHRADWRVDFVARPDREPYSRGQAKLVALACLLAQARQLHEARGEWPVILLDDFASELDSRHRQRVLDQLDNDGIQVFLSGVDTLPEITGKSVTMFHVEHGQIHPAS
ncbi:DNA replication/repair protein RecF [Solilutibacter tolerans]|uniref:DNA replication and repair protein RecF n=1 Tax=Solilutibacter tolerans TaxID=1604334 RepID=A0A1N6RF84_9GAMM|nr:DNA replication/repair protein RecF [Lysobacter tolerans]SIQ27503.1 DNA replication and repair protein RecF [Lysobacter tolerans]